MKFPSFLFGGSRWTITVLWFGTVTGISKIPFFFIFYIYYNKFFKNYQINALFAVFQKLLSGISQTKKLCQILIDRAFVIYSFVYSLYAALSIALEEIAATSSTFSLLLDSSFSFLGRPNLAISGNLLRNQFLTMG